MYGLVNIGRIVTKHGAISSNGNRGLDELGVIANHLQPALFIEFSAPDVFLIIRMRLVHQVFWVHVQGFENLLPAHVGRGCFGITEGFNMIGETLSMSNGSTISTGIRIVINKNFSLVCLHD